MVRLPREQIAARWHGTYAAGASQSGAFVGSPENGVTIVTGGGGSGMTMSFGLAQEMWNAL